MTPDGTQELLAWTVRVDDATDELQRGSELEFNSARNRISLVTATKTTLHFRLNMRIFNSHGEGVESIVFNISENDKIQLYNTIYLAKLSNQ